MIASGDDLHISRPARGSTAPKTDRRTVLAAMADAACTVKASTRYVWIVIIAVKFPTPMNAVPIIGTVGISTIVSNNRPDDLPIQCTP